uniref:Uncharacterized protein n=1 Tax=Molossus molossus TaxID=27622 RepID=A0A7J8HCL8_MOLMO|nr:hypothetical protein HJG59_011142 [Molossus molossus]
MGIALNLQIALGNMNILMMLILPIHEQGTCFHFFISSSIFFPLSYSFLQIGPLFLCLSLFLGILIFFVAMVNGIVFSVSLSVSSSLVYKKANDFLTLILYPATLPNSFMKSSKFLMESLGFSMYSIMSSANYNSFTFSFPI